MDNIISIIIPAYNIEHFLDTALESVLSQSYTNLEIIVVNDGSSDGTGAVMNAYASRNERVRVIHKENGGVTSARLAGVAAARGEWIGFVDGDDRIEPQMYQRLLENALAHNADISHCGYQRVIPSRVDYYYNTGKLVLQDHDAGLHDLIEGQFIEPGLCNKLYRRELFAGLTERMDITIRNNEDLLMNYWLFKAAQCSVYEDVCPYHYIVRKNSATTSRLTEHKLWDPLRVTQIILEDAPEKIRPAAFRRLVRILISGTSMDLGQDQELIQHYRKHARRELRAEISGILLGNQCSFKLKTMALWSLLWPASYGFVHKLYEKISGLDKIYSIE